MTERWEEAGDTSPYHCSPEWHFARLTKTPLAGLLCSFAFRISGESGSFHGSVVGLARYFNVSRWKIQRAFNALVAAGFLVPIAREAFKPTEYRVVSHRDWAGAHPGCCTEKETMPWSHEEGDPLAKKLWNASGGRMKYKPFQLAALRKLGLTDEEIVAAFRPFAAAEKARREASGWHGGWDRVHQRFLRWLSGNLRPDELEKLNLEPFCLPAGPVEAPSSSIVA